MLTARYGKNHLCIPLNRIIKRIIRRRITGMQGHYHVYRKRCLIAVDVAQFKMQIVIALFLRRKIAVFDHVLFQIKSYDLHVHFFDLRKIIIQDKSQVRLSAAEINDI